jgi:hypothetical protein
LWKSPIADHSLIHQLFRLGQRTSRDHGRQKGIARSANRCRLPKNRLAGSVAVGNPETIAAIALSRAVEQRRGCAVDGGTKAGLKWDIHREDHIINLVGQLAGSQHVQQGGCQIGLKVITGPKGVAARPVDAQHIFRWHLSCLTVVITKLAGIGTVLINNDNCVQSTATRVQIAHPNTAHHGCCQHSVAKTVVHTLNTTLANELRLLLCGGVIITEPWRLIQKKSRLLTGSE